MLSSGVRAGSGPHSSRPRKGGSAMGRSALGTAVMLFAGLVGMGSASAGSLGPLTPQCVSVGDRDAVLYYVETQAGYEVVVTFAANARGSLDDVLAPRPSACRGTDWA